MKGVNKMDQPEMNSTESWGYPKEFEHKHILVDSRFNEIHAGDEYLQYDGEIYLAESLSDDAVAILERHGAIRKTA